MQTTTDRYLSKFIEKAPSLLSLKSLTEDLNVSHYIVEWCTTILENLYMRFKNPSFGNELKDDHFLNYAKN
jgi:hypothetical protein